MTIIGNAMINKGCGASVKSRKEKKTPKNGDNARKSPARAAPRERSARRKKTLASPP